MSQFDETEVVEDDETTEDEPKDTESSDVSDRLDRIEENSTLNSLLADPDIQKVLDLKKAGKVVQIDEEKDEEEESVIDDDDPAAEVLKKFEGIIDKKLSPFSDRLAQIETIASSVQLKEVNSAISKSKEDHKDFEEYKDAMLKLSKEQPGLTIEELYIVSKSRAGKLDTADPDTFSEKPTPDPRRRVLGTKKAGPSKYRGKQGFKTLMTEALEKLSDSGTLG